MAKNEWGIDENINRKIISHYTKESDKKFRKRNI